MSSSRRLFFALWPDQGVRRSLDDIARQHRPSGSRAISPANLHATLVFLGPVDEALLVPIQQAAEYIREESFTLLMQQLQHWRRPQVLCLCSDTVPKPLLNLHHQLRQLLSDIGLETESRKYRPHVTLARKVRDYDGPACLPQAVDWKVNGFSLVESVSGPQGVEYRVLHRWSLSNADQA